VPLLTVVAGVLAAWLGLSVLAAVAFGQAVRLAERHRPRLFTRPARARGASALERVVELATGSIPIIRPRVD
jgi:hypothetical protein